MTNEEIKEFNKKQIDNMSCTILPNGQPYSRCVALLQEETLSWSKIMSDNNLTDLDLAHKMLKE